MNDGWLSLEVLAYGVFWVWLLGLVPAALATALKERWLYFSAGWLVLGIPWFIGALRLANPNSGWAKRFYGAERMARAADPARHRRPARVTALWLSGSLALLLAIGLPTARPAAFTGVDGGALQHSVSGISIGFYPPPCRHDHGRTWICSAYDSNVSGTVPFPVEIRPLGCWVAAQPYRAETSRRHLSGCITAWDILRVPKAI